MGNAVHRPSSRPPRGGRGRGGGAGSVTVGAAEDAAVARLRTSLHHDLHTFVLNNVLLSVQFFRNYEREVAALKTMEQTEQVQQWNQKLHHHHHRHSLTPDRLHQLVARKVQIRHPQEHHTLPLAPQRIIVEQENVKVVQKGCRKGCKEDDAGVRYRLYKEPDSPGYIRLYSKEMPVNRRVSYDIINDDDDDDDRSSCESHDDGIGVHARRTRKHDNCNQSSSQGIIKNDDDSKTSKISKPDCSKTEETNDDRQATPQQCIQDHTTTTTNNNNNHHHEVAYKRRNIFGPRSPEMDNRIVAKKQKNVVFTRTERRLSGVVRSPKYPSVSLRWIGENHGNAMGNHNHHHHTNRLSPRDSDSSGYKSNPNSRGSDTETGYGILTGSQHKPVQYEKNIPKLQKFSQNSSEIPAECFDMLEVPYHHDDDDDDDNVTKLFETRYYLNSKKLFSNFGDLFIEHFFQIFEFPKNTSTTMHSETIHCDVITTTSLVQDGGDGGATTMAERQMAIAPSFFCHCWPEEADEWRRRKRNVVQRGRVRYQWPTPTMMEKIQQWGHSILPAGATVGNDSSGTTMRGQQWKAGNKRRGQQWRVEFPKAEEYLETCLTHPQMHCYLTTMALYRTFLEPLAVRGDGSGDDDDCGLTHTHIRNLMFWLCEKDYSGWSEDNPADNLRHFLDNLYEALAKGRLSHYFVAGRDLWEGASTASLRRAQERLHRMRENLLPHVLLALDNITDCGGPPSSPVLDYATLYELVVVEAAAAAVARVPAGAPPVGTEERDDDKGRRWNKQVRRQIEAERVAQTLVRGRASPAPYIDVQRPVKSRSDATCRYRVLQLLVPHMVAMARSCKEAEWYHRCLVYLRQARRLTALLHEESPPNSNGHQQQVEGYRLQVRVLWDDAIRRQAEQEEKGDGWWLAGSGHQDGRIDIVNTDRVRCAPAHYMGAAFESRSGRDAPAVPVPNITIGIHAPTGGLETDTDMVDGGNGQACQSQREQHRQEEEEDSRL